MSSRWCGKSTGGPGEAGASGGRLRDRPEGGDSASGALEKAETKPVFGSGTGEKEGLK